MSPSLTSVRDAPDGGESVDTSPGEIAGFAGGAVDTTGVIAAAHRHAGGPEIPRHRAAIDLCRRGDPTDRPSQAPEREDLLLCGLLQDVAHSGEGHQVRRPRQRLGRRQLMAGFEVSIKCGI